MSIGKLIKKELEDIKFIDKISKDGWLKDDEPNLSGREAYLAKKEIEADRLCSECGMYKKELSSYCKVCWDSKHQN